MKIRPDRFVMTSFAFSILCAMSGGVGAQNTPDTVESQDDTNQQKRAEAEGARQTVDLSNVVVTGTRTSDRTKGSSLSPVDVIPHEVLTQTGTVDMARALERTVPSLDLPDPTDTDTSVFQRAFALRGLSADQTLVLVNGKRWHPGAVLKVASEVGQGTQAPDISSIPMSAVDHIEVLRGGASAMYGSDAIAGVVNIILKKGAQGGSALLSGGKYSAGDGPQWRGATDFGIPLGDDKGWLRVSAEMSNQSAANRSKPDRRPGYSQLGPKFEFGVTPFRDKNVFLNMQYDLAPSVQLYAFGHWGQRVGEPRGYYRYGTNTPDPATPLMAELFPDGGGFLPKEHGVSTDKSLAVGVRGETDNGWRWDVSGGYGANRVSYATWNSINFAYYDDFGYSPRRMHDGMMRAAQGTFDIDISKDLAENWTLSFGAGYLYQKNTLEAGEEASWYVSTTSPEEGGAQGFSGWGPQDAYTASRHAVSEYVQLEGNITDKLSTSVAARHEDYSDFGTTTSGAVSARFEFSDTFALRGTVSTGFRAPGLAQQYYGDAASSYLGTGNTLGVPQGIYLTGMVPVDNPLAELLGSEPLKPEKSRNYTVGMVWNPSQAFTTSVDIYKIVVRNRIAPSSSISLTDPDVLAYLASHGIAQPDYVGVSYFTNAGDVRTRGVDWVSSYNRDFENGGSLVSTFSATYHWNKVDNIRPNPEVLNQFGDVGFQRLTRSQIKGTLADEMPRMKLIWTNTFNIGYWGFTGTLTRYGRFTRYSGSGYENDIVSPDKWIFDIAASYYHDKWNFTLGVDNLFNTYPDKYPDGHDVHGSLPYPPNTPFPAVGALVYGKVAYSW